MVKNQADAPHTVLSNNKKKKLSRCIFEDAVF